MTTLESASKRLEAAIQTLEAKIAHRARIQGDGQAVPDGAALDSLQQKYDDLNNEYEALLQRYESLIEKNLALSDRLDGVVTRLKQASLNSEPV